MERECKNFFKDVEPRLDIHVYKLKDKDGECFTPLIANKTGWCRTEKV